MSKLLVSSTEPEMIRKLGKSSVTPENYGLDIMWNVTVEDEPIRRWGIQRKEYKDLIASVDGDRLAREFHQARSVDQVVMLIEGKFRFDPGGYLLTSGSQRTRWTRESIRALLISVQNHGWWIVQTQELIETVEAVKTIKAWSEKVTHNSLIGRPPIKAELWGKATDREFAAWVLQSAPNVGLETARRIYDALGPVVALTATDEELLSVKGVGPKVVERLRQAFGG